MRAPLPILCAALGALAAIVALGGACERPGSRSPARRVILITCDTLRADRLGLYGYERPVSPHLDALAREGVVFGEAYATAPMTQPSMSGLMAGRLPQELGLDRGNLKLLAPDVVTLAERIRAAGIPTAAIVSNWVLRSQASEKGDVGVQQGFDFFDDRMMASEAKRNLVERLADGTTDAAAAWLARTVDEGTDRFFLWIHYQDPHGPYTPPDDLAQQFARPAVEPVLRVPLGTTKYGKGQIPQYQSLGGRMRVGFYEGRYDGEVAYFDRALGRLLDWPRERDLLDDALVVFTADHGESMGEHDYWFCHGESLYRELVRVPLVIRYPTGVPTPADGERDGQAWCGASVGHLDLWPTILEALGIEPGPTRGRSLLRAGLPAQRVQVQSLFPADESLPAWHAVSDGRWRLVWRADGSEPELYDVQADPAEEHDLARDEPERVAALRAAHDAYLAARSAADTAGVEMELDAEARQALEDLGYVDGGVEDADDTGDAGDAPADEEP